MDTTSKRTSPRATVTSGLAVVALALSGSALRAQGDAPPQPATRAGAYTVSIEESRLQGGGFAATRAFGAFGPNGGQAVQSNTSVGLRIQAAGREDAMRLLGVASPLTATDDRGKKVEVVGVLGPLPSGFGPARSADKYYQVQLFVPEGRTRTLKTLEGELLVTESRLQRLEFTGKELAQGVEKKVGDHVVKLDPIKATEQSTSVQLSLKAALDGERAVTQRPGQPQVIVELTDTHGRSYEPRAMTFSGLGGGNANAFFGGGGFGAGAFPPGGPGFGPRLPVQPQFGGGPVNARFNSSFQTRYEFPPIHNDEEVKNIVCYVLIPSGEPKRVPFRLTGVPLPLPPADVQKQP